MRKLFCAAFAAATLTAGSAAAFPGEYEIPAFPLPDIASHVAIYGTPDDPKFWEGPDVDDTTIIKFRAHGLIDVMFSFKIKDATPNAYVSLGAPDYDRGQTSGTLGMTDEFGNFESGLIPLVSTNQGYLFNTLVVGPKWPAGATIWQSFDMYDFQLTGLQGPAVPEPTTWALMILGFGAVGAAMRRRRLAAILA